MKQNVLFYKKRIKTYRDLLTSSRKSIEKAYKRNLKDNRYSSMGYIQIYDNFHVLSKSFDLCKCSPFLKSKPYPPLFIHIYNFLSERDFSADENDFSSFLFSLGKKYYFTYKELFHLSAFISAACIFEVGRICENANIPEKSEEGLKKLPALISLLRDKENWDFEKLISQSSKTEKTFIEHEPSFSIMDSMTKNRYRETFSAFCEAQNIEEKVAAELLNQYCLEKNACIGDIIFKEEKLPALLFTVLSAVFTITVISGAVFFLNSFFAILALPSVIITAMSFSDVLMSAHEKTKPCPRLELKEIPLEAKTAVVISTLLINEDDNAEICNNLERFYLLNRDENLCFAVLADFPNGKEEKPSEKEKLVMENLFSEISLLNSKYKNKFTVFVRNRKYNPEEKICYGEERKRGAICALINFITEGLEFDYTHGNTSNLSDVKYLFLLDSDTGIGFSSVREAVSCALHPQNKPVIENGRVVKGYGVFQPAVKFGLVHENQTYFQSFITGAGGLDNYESASYDRFQSIFESGIFCGKGLIDVKLYKSMVIPNIQSGAVLSHDMPEGNLLRCRLVSDITTTDDVPNNAISYFSRLHRWIRGDVQNLIFLQNKHMSAYSVFKILNNVLRHITPAFSLLLILSFAFLDIQKGIFATFFSLLYLIFPFFSVLVFAPARAYNKSTVIGRRFYSKVSGVYASNAMRLIYEISLLPHLAFVSVNAFSKSLYRMYVSKKGLLEWKTFGQNQRESDSSLLGYYCRFFANVFSGIILLLTQKFIFCVLGIVWILTPVVLFLLSKPMKEENPIGEEEKRVISEYAEKIWDFFNDNVDGRTNHLPPDNIQTAPTDAVAYRTSPTNIGFYLISCLAAFDFGFISQEELERRIDNTLSSIEKLDKYKGHLYNWYELKHLKILGEKFVSTVDSGNFVTMLVALNEGLLELGLKELSSRTRRIIENTDFSCLYNEKKKLFTIGINGETGKSTQNCYDLFMSEARTTSYFAVATHQVPNHHWKALGRTLISEKGYLGMASWSGTMFEYFMSVLFLPLYKNSFSYEALSFAFNEQKRFSAFKLWGTSESGFYSFDSELNYQYKAHGVPSLSLKRYPKNEKIFSPYSSFLTLCINRKASLSNLQRFKESGLWGRYGFYESVDFTNGKAIVKSYMSHHMGMSLIASANACFDGIFVKRFMRDKEMNAACGLLKERIPTNSPVYKNPDSETELSRLSPKLFDGITSLPSAQDPKVALISNGNLDLRISDCGACQLLYRGIPICETTFAIGKLYHSFTVGFIDVHGKIHYPAPLLSEDFNACSFEFGRDYSSHIISNKDFAASVCYRISERGDCFIIETKGNIKRKYSPFIAFEPQMKGNLEYYSAKSFSMMKTRCEFDEEGQCIFIQSDDSSFTVCVQCEKKLDAYLTKHDFFKVGSLFDELNVKESVSDEFSVYPFCYMKSTLLSGGCCRFFVGIGKNKAQSKAACEREKKKRSSISKAPLSVDPQLLSGIASKILFKKARQTEEAFSPMRRILWKKGISGDYSILSLYVKDQSTEELTEYIKAYVISHIAHLKYELFIFFDEEDVYFRKLENKLKLIIQKAGGFELLDKNPGIRLLNRALNLELFEKKDTFAFFKTLSNKIYYNEEKKMISPPLEETVPLKKTNKFISVDKSKFVFHKGSIKLRKPYSYILAGKSFGSVLTDSSLGFTFSENSRLLKLSYYDESPNSEDGEKIFAVYHNKLFDLCKCSEIFKCKNGVALYEGEFLGVKYSLCVFVSPTKKKKYIIASFSEDGITAIYSFTPLLGENLNSSNRIQFKKKEDKKETAVIFYDSLSLISKDVFGTCSAQGTEPLKPFPLLEGESINVSSTGRIQLFTLGESETEEFPTGLELEEALAEKTAAEDFAKGFVPPLSFETQYENLDLIFPFLFYQTAASRFYTKTGYYQNGGAFGFRDQLQDCLSLVYSAPTEVRNHLLKAASHQYEEGDVMHWWHELKGEHFGVRTECSDDYLWLPFVVAKYIKLTGDMAILEENVPFLFSLPLNSRQTPPSERVNERYEKATFSEKSGSLLEHCILALKRGFENRKDGIPLMGSCDWNDGFSQLGSKGIGKSLFTARLLVMATEAFAPLLKNTPDLCDELLFKALELDRLIEEKYFIGGQYVRCISDDGTVFGIGETKACATDILCQAFAVLGGKNKERGKRALLSAYSKLYEKETKTLRLFYPPFTDKTEKAGYINTYPPFVRENSGQYTHAAVWTAIALIKCGEGEAGLNLLSQINPLERCKTVAEAEIYKNEPYVLSADIYSGQFGGRGGWSWYTGAASWFSVAIIEHVLGLNFSGSLLIDGVEKYVGSFKCLSVEPLIPYTAKISLGDYTLNVTAKKGSPLVLLDGEISSFPIIIPPKDSDLEIYF